MIQAIIDNEGKVKVNFTGTYQELFKEIDAIKELEDTLRIRNFEINYMT